MVGCGGRLTIVVIKLISGLYANHTMQGRESQELQNVQSNMVVEVVKKYPNLSAVTNTGRSVLDLAVNIGVDDKLVRFLQHSSNER